jgi:hypothetical protein
MPESDCSPNVPQDGSPAEAIGQIPQLIKQLQEFAAYYVSAQAGLVGAKARQAVLAVVILAIAALMGAAATVTAMVLLLVGAAEGLARLFGGRPWLGNLVLGFAILLLIVVGTWLAIRGARNRARDATVREFETRKDMQRGRLHTSVVEQSGAVDVGVAESVSKS